MSNNFTVELGGQKLGGEVLVAIAQGRESGILRWSTAHMSCELWFIAGRPQASVFNEEQFIDESQVINYVRSFAVVDAGQCVFERQNSLPCGDALQIDTLGQVLLALLEDFRLSQVKSVLAARGEMIVIATPMLGHLSPMVEKITGLQIPHLGSGMTFSEVIPGGDLTLARSVLALITLGAVTLQPQKVIPASFSTTESSTESRAESRAERTVTASDHSITANSDTAEPLPEDPHLRSLCREILGVYKRIGTDKTHYEVLAVDTTVTAEEVKEAFFTFAKKWHVDKISARGVPDYFIDLVKQVFQAAEEAKRVLSNDSERKDYDYVLERKALGLPSDPRIIMEAESLFVQGQNMVKRGQVAAAEPMLRQATEMNKGEPDFWIYLGFALYSVKGSDAYDEAVAMIKRAMEERENKYDYAYEFLGRMAHAEGNIPDAIKLLNDALEINEKNVNCQRELRLINMRKSKAKEIKKSAGGGGLAGLFGKFGK